MSNNPHRAGGNREVPQRPGQSPAASEQAVNSPTATLNKRIVTLANGMTVLKAKDRQIFGAWLLDWFIVLVTSLATFFALLNNDPLTALAAAAAVWPAGSFVYGFTTCFRRSLGQAAAGTRTIRLDNGGVPGFWRAGWVMFVRLVVYPFIVGVLLLGALSGSADVGDAKDRHLSIDVRETEALKGREAGHGSRPAQGSPRRQESD